MDVNYQVQEPVEVVVSHVVGKAKAEGKDVIICGIDEEVLAETKAEI